MEKKIMIALALLAVFSCSRESYEPAVPEGPCEIRADIDPDGPATRAILLDNPGVRMDAVWSGGDKIGLAGTSGAAVLFQVAAEDIASNGKSAVFRSESGVPSGSLTAFYPWQEGTSLSGGKLTMDFPAVQHYSLGRGVPQPDPSVALMAGTGTARNGVAFRNIMAVLKVGQAFDEATTVASVEFRDPADQAVSGRVTIDLANNFASTVSGGGAVLTLDCGEGVELKPGELGKFFLVVPARTYARGLEITFVTKEGQRFTRTSGASSGVTLGRGIIYPVGDIPNQDYVSGTGSSKLASNAILMTPELLRNSVLLNSDKHYVRNLDGGYVTDQVYGHGNGTPIMRPYYNMILPANLGLQEGSFVVFEATDDLPGGGVFKVTEYEFPFADPEHCRVNLEMTPDFAKAFDKVDFGGEMFDAEGNPIEGAGLQLDLPGYLKEVRDVEGEAVPFSVTPEGAIAFSAEDTERLLTRALFSADKSLTFPSLNFSYSGDLCSASLGAELTIDMRAACKIDQGELAFVHFMFHPKLNLSAEFSITKKWSFNKEVPLFTLVCGGIPVAPGVIIVPEVYVSACIGANAEIKLTTHISYTYDMGRFGFSYQKDVGFSFRRFESEPSKEDIQPDMGAALSGALSVYAGLIAEPYISLYGLFGAGIQTEFRLTFSYEHKAVIPYGYTSIIDLDDQCLKLTPSLSFTPHTASLGGLFSKKWENLQTEISFDPIWQRYLFPQITAKEGEYFMFMLDREIMISGRPYKYASGGRYGLIGFNENNHPRLPFDQLTRQHNYVKYAIQTVKDRPTLDDFRIVLDIGTVKGYTDWWNMTGGNPDLIAYNWTQYGLDEGTVLRRYELLDIPAGNTKVIAEAGQAGTPEMFPSGEIRYILVKAVNKRTGAETNVFWTPPFMHYWPSTPKGPIFSYLPSDGLFDGYYSQSEERYITSQELYEKYDAPVWPSGVPLP